MSSQHQPKNINDDICQAKYFPCQVIKEKTSEPDFSDDAFETANEYSDDEDKELIMRSDYKEDDKSRGSCVINSGNEENELIIRSHYEAEDKFGGSCVGNSDDEDNELIIRSYYEEDDKSGGSRNDEDDDDSGRLVPETRLNGDDHVELNNKFTTVNFEFGDSKRKYAKETVGETLVFTCKPKHFSELRVNKIARKTTYPCFPISQEESNPSTSEYSCIQFSKQKLFMRDDNLLLFIPSDCKITTETGQELIKENRLQYDDIQREDPENLQVGNVIVNNKINIS